MGVFGWTKSSRRFVSRAVLLPAGYHPNVSIPGASLNFVWIMAAHREVVDRKWGVMQVDPRYG
jgi:5-deoxy-glucuronate isomerase